MAFVVGRLVTALGLDVTNFDAGLNAAKGRGERAARQIEREFGRIGNRFSSLGRDLTLVTAPLVIAGGLALKNAVTFEQAFARVRKTIGGTTEELAGLQRGIRDLAAGEGAIPIDVNQLARIAELGGQLGIERPNLQGFTKDIAELSIVAKDIPAEEAATGIAQLSNVMGTSQREVRRFASTIVGLGDSMITNERQILDFGIRLSSAGKIAGLTEANVLALAGSLASVGLEAESGGTAFSRVISKIDESVKTGNKNLAEFAKVAGVSAAEFSQKWSTEPARALELFLHGMGRVQKQGGELFRVLEILKFENVRTADALKRSGLAAEKFSTAIGASSKFWEENIALTQKANVIYDTTASQLQVAKNRIVEVSIAIGEQLAPLAVKGANSVAALAEAFGKLPGPVKDTAFALVGALLVTNLLSLGFGRAFSVLKATIPGIAPAFRGFVAAFGELPAILRTNTTALGGFLKYLGPGAAGLTFALGLAAAAAGALIGTGLNTWMHSLGEETLGALGPLGKLIKKLQDITLAGPQRDEIAKGIMEAQRGFERGFPTKEEFDEGKGLDPKHANDPGPFLRQANAVRRLEEQLGILASKSQVAREATIQSAEANVGLEMTYTLLLREQRQAIAGNEDLRKSFQKMVPDELDARIQSAQQHLDKLNGVIRGAALLNKGEIGIKGRNETFQVEPLDLKTEDARQQLEDLTAAIGLTGVEWEVFRQGSGATNEKIEAQAAKLKTLAASYLGVMHSVQAVSAAQKAAGGPVTPQPTEEQQKAIDTLIKKLKEHKLAADTTRKALSDLEQQDAAAAAQAGTSAPAYAEEARALERQQVAVEDLQRAQKERLDGVKELADEALTRQELAENRATKATQDQAIAQQQATKASEHQSEAIQARIEHENALKVSIQSIELQRQAVEAALAADAQEKAAHSSEAATDPQRALARATREVADAWVLAGLAASGADKAALEKASGFQDETEASRRAVEASEALTRAKESARTSDQQLAIEAGKLKAQFESGGLSVDEYRQALVNLFGVQDLIRTADQQQAIGLDHLRDLYEQGAISLEQYRTGILAVTGLTEAVKTEHEKSAEALARLNQQYADGVISIDQWVIAARQIETTASRVADAAQQAFADFLFAPFEDGLKGMVVQFGNAMRRMLADQAAQQLTNLLFGVIAGAVGGSFAGLGGGATRGVSPPVQVATGGLVSEQRPGAPPIGSFAGRQPQLLKVKEQSFILKAAAVQKYGIRGRGLIKGPGTGTSDSVQAITDRGRPLRLSAGEYEFGPEDVQRIGLGRLHAMNRLEFPALERHDAERMASGGLVGSSGSSSIDNSTSGMTFSPTYNVDARGAAPGEADRIRVVLAQEREAFMREAEVRVANRVMRGGRYSTPFRR